MKENVFKVLVVALLLAIIVLQLKSNDVGRYEIGVHRDLDIFDNKTGKLYVGGGGIIDIIESSKRAEKEFEQRARKEFEQEE